MFIDSQPEFQIQLDEIQSDDELRSEVDSLEEENRTLVYVVSSLKSYDKLRKILLALRSANVSAIVLLKESDRIPSVDEIDSLFRYLRDWDQLFLHNVLQLAEPWIPEKFREKLRSEVKHELKWFREWFLACSDPRIYKYPTLPWRSYIRKVTGENFEFAKALLKNVGLNPSIPVEEIDRMFLEFLDRKQHVLCTFPKRWERVQ